MYAKVFSQIFDSSIAGDYRIRHFFEDMLKLADIDGVVDMTPDAISRRTNVPIELVTDGLKALMEPDPLSRSKEEEGRRIVLIDSHRNWGWRIVNYRHYRELRDEEARKSYFRDYMRDYRAKNSKSVTKPRKTLLNSVNHRKPRLTHAEAEAEAEEKENTHTEGVSERIGKVEELKRLLSSFMSRKPGQQWSHVDDFKLAEICRRPDCLSEFQELKAFRGRLKESKFFPQSVGKLLENWDDTLDRSRRPPDFSEWDQKAMDKMIPKLQDPYGDDD